MFDCVHAVHKIGYLHLDIKLENFVIDSNNKVRIIDFGFVQKYELDG